MSGAPLDGRVALVTGGGRGIGRAVALELARCGARILIGVRSAEAAARALVDLRAEGAEVEAALLDVCDDASVRAAAERVTHEIGRLDVLVNNAGVLVEGSALTLAAPVVRAVFETNVLGPWRVTAAFAPLLRASPHGRVVNVSSGAGSIAELPDKVSPDGTSSHAPYRISKAALNALTRLQAIELGPDGILVNAVCPGWVRTDMGGATATRSPAQGAASVMRLVLVSDDGPTGGFFRDGVPVPW